MEGSDQLHEHVLFAVYAVQLGFATPTEVADASIASGTRPGISLAERLHQDGVITAQQRKLIEQRVRHEMRDSCATVTESSASRPAAGSPAATDLPVQGDGTLADNLPPDDVPESEENVTLAQPGRYTMKGVHGRGGQARIMLAFDEHIGREVAVKELLSDDGTGEWDSAFGSSSLQRSTPGMVRFLREARVTGQLEHPNIVPVYEVGRREDGTIYYTMRLVRGTTMARKLKDCKTLSDRMKLLGSFWDVCNAIAFAHSHGVVHRDIKPENAMLGEFGETVLLDWGVAKVRGKRDIRAYDIEKELRLFQKASEGHTAAGTAIGTPSYMSPEQARGEIDEIDERSDVWGLGAVLYEILTGRPPYKGETPMETILMVGEEPIQPVRKLCPDAPPELAAVAEKALQRNKAKRYQGAKALSEDVGAYMTGERVASYEYSAWELLKRFARHNKPALIAASLILAVIIGALVAVSFSLRAETQARKAAQDARQAEETALAKEQAERRLANFHLAQAYTEKADRMVEDQRYLAAAVFASASLLHNPAQTKSPFFDPDFLSRHPQSRTLWVEAASKVYRLAFGTSADLQQAMPASEVLAGCAFSPDGKHLAVASFDKTVQVWKIGKPEPVFVLEGHRDRVYAVAYSPDGKLLASAGLDKQILLWNAAGGKLVRKLRGHGNLVHALAFSPDGKLLASVGWDSTARLWDFRKGRAVQILKGHTGKVEALAFSPDGKQLATAGTDKRVLLWEIPSGRQRAAFEHADDVKTVRFSPDGKLLASAGNDMRVTLRDLGSGSVVRTLDGHKDGILSLAFSPDARLLASAGYDKTMRLWDVESGQPLLNIGGHANFVYSVVFSPDGKLLATSGYDKLARIWKLEDGRGLTVMRGHTDVPYGVAFSPDGKLLASGGLDRTIRVWNAKNGRIRHVLRGHEDVIANVAISLDSRLLASTSKDRTVRIWSLKSGKPLRVLHGHTGWAYGVDFSPDGELLASAGADRTIRIWNAKTGAKVLVIKGHNDAIDNVRFSPDGRYLASAGYDRTVRIWDPRTGRQEQIMSGHEDWISGVDYSPDGKWIASSSKDGTAIIWDQSTGKERLRLRGHEQWVNSVRFSHDCELVATASDDRTVRVWSLSDGRPMLILSAEREVVAIAFSPDSLHLAVGDGLNVKLYPMDFATLDADPAGLLTRAEKRAGLSLEGFDLEVAGVR